MKFKNILMVLFMLFLGFTLMVDCAHKKQQSEEITDQNLTEAELPGIQINTLTEEEIADGWELLFDGQTLDGWRSFNMEENSPGWIVEDGQMVALGKGSDAHGDLITDKEYQDFDLKFEWKISKEGNSGLFFRVLEESYQTVYETGPEYQIIDDLEFPDPLSDWQTTGANYGLHAPQNPKILPAGEWNRSQIIVMGSEVSHFLNGSLVVKYELWSPEWEALVIKSKWSEYPGYGKAKSGHIGLQDHGNMVWFRNIKIKAY